MQGKIKLSKKVPVTDDVKIFRFSTNKNYYTLLIILIDLPDENTVLGMKVGEAIQLKFLIILMTFQWIIASASIKNNDITNENIISRYFVPISRIDDFGIVDLLVRVYKKDEKTHFEGGIFSNYINNLQVN